MKTRYTSISAALILAAVLIPLSLGAQAVQLIDYNPDARTAGLAGAGASLQASAFSLWNNTAAPALSESTMDAAVSYGMWQPSAAGVHAISAAGYGRVAKFMTVSAGVRYFTHPAYDMTDASGSVTGSFTPTDLTAGVGLAFRILPILSLGAGVHYVYSDIGGPQKGGAVSADFGAMLDLRFLRVGLTASNIGSKINYGGLSAYSLPMNIRLGAGTTQYLGAEDRHALTASLQGGFLIEGASFFAEAGLEYAWNDMVRVSAGYHYGDAAASGAVPSYASVGAGFKILGIYIDAAYLIPASQDSPLSNTFSVGVGYRF